MSGAKSCSCSGADLLILSSSGSSDVGEIADQPARRLTRDGVGKMYWLTGIGGRIARTVKTAQASDRILAIDGCVQNCASQCLKEAGFQDFAILNLAEHVAYSQTVAFVSPLDLRKEARRVGAPEDTNDLRAQQTIPNEQTGVGVVTPPPLRDKIFAHEVTDQLVLV